MKRKNTLWSLVLALVMVLGVIAPLGALAASKATETKTVTLHKLMMTPDKLKAWDSEAIEKAGYNGSQDLAALQALEGVGQDVRQVADVYFVWKEQGSEKYIAAEHDKEGKVTNPLKPALNQKMEEKEGQKVPVKDADGNLVYEYETTTDIEKAMGGKTLADGIKFETTGLKGAFEIKEVKEKSTYKTDEGMVIAGQKAIPVKITLPLVNNEGPVEAAHVYPKNTEEKPKIDKNFAKEHGLAKIEDTEGNINAGADVDNYNKAKAKAQAEVGKEIKYEVVTKIDKDTSYERLVWNDIMTNGLTFNKNVELTSDDISLVKGTDYKVVQDDNGFRLEMLESGLDKIKAITTADKSKDVNIKLTYSATVNGTAVVDKAEKNNVALEYGHQKGKDLEKKPVTPKGGKLKVTKKFGDGAELDKLKIVYTLRKGDEVKASVALDNKTVNKTIDLGNGIKFVVGADPFNGEFQGLGDDAKDWTISERVAGYNPAYAETNAAGEVTITNNKDNDNPKPIEPTTPEVVVGGKKFVKTTETATELLAGAKFVIKNEAGTKYLAAKSVDTVEDEKAKLEAAKKALDEAVKAYNDRKDDTNESTLKATIDTKQEAYNKAFKTAGIRYEWVDSNTAAGVVILASNSKGQFMIEGLEYGKYKLEEIQPPKGYAKINDQGFEVAEGTKTDTNIKYDVDSAANDAKQVINKKVTIPQTGGIGTMIFMVAGLALMGGAFIAMRKRSAEQA